MRYIEESEWHIAEIAEVTDKDEITLSFPDGKPDQLGPGDRMIIHEKLLDPQIGQAISILVIRRKEHDST